MARSRVELFEQIRKDSRAEGSSIRQLAERHGVHRRTVRQALVSAVPPPRRAYPPRPRPAIDPYVQVIDAWLLADKGVPRKQRHTGRRVWQRLVAEHGADGVGGDGVTVCGPPPSRAGPGPAVVSVPQAHLPGAEAEVDFGEFHAMATGVMVKLWLFVLRLSCSGRAFHVAFATQAQEAFLEGHVLAFEYFGAVPGRIRYDNLKPAVTGSCGAGTAWRPSGSSRCARITGSTRSSASPASRARTRRAGSRVRSAGSADGTWCPSPRWRRWLR